jgi:hypothetical protein
MAQIATYSAPENLGLQPTEVGIEAKAAAARRLEAFYSQISESQVSIGRDIAGITKTAGDLYDKVETHREVSHGAAAFSSLFNNLETQWNDTAKGADPNDPSVAAKFRETVLEPELNKFRAGFTTEKSQQWAESHVDSLRQHMFQKTAADMSTLAGIAVQKNYTQASNSLASAARNDPSSLDMALKTAETSIGGIVDSSPTLKASDAARVKEEMLQKTQEAIVKSAVVGMIEKNPNIDLAEIEKKYGKYITGPEMQMFQKAAKTQAKSDLLTERQLQLHARQMADQDAHAAANKNFSDNVSIDEQTNRPIINPQFFKGALDIVRNNPGAPSANQIARTYIDWGEHQQNLKDEAIRTDPMVKASLLNGMFDASKPTTELDILRQEADNKLSPRDGTILRAMVKEMGPNLSKDPIIHTAIDAAKERVGETLMVDGHERFANFMQAFLPEYMRQKAAGTLPPNALDLKDEKSLIRQSLKAYEPSASERMYAHTLKSIGATPQSLNLTGPDRTTAVQSVQNKPPFVPPQTWEYSASRDQFRDPATGKFYDRAGKEVKPRVVPMSR